MTEHSEWRFRVDTDGTITRGRIYRLVDPDGWANYWDGDFTAAFYDEGFRGIRALTEDEDTARAIAAHKYERGGDKGAEGGLDRVARRITGQWNSRFIVVHLDRGTDLYALAWGGDPDNEWRDEIEAVWNNDVYRIETERYEESGWQPDDDVCEEFYGEDSATDGWRREFPLDHFPAEVVLTEAGA